MVAGPTSANDASSDVLPRSTAPAMFEVDPRRFRVLCFFSIFSFTNAMQWITYAPMFKEAQHFFDMSTAQLNSLSWIYMVVYVALIVVSCAAVEKLGLKASITIGALLNAVGSVLKVVAALLLPRFWLVFTAQFINAVAQMFVLSTPPQLAAMWFPANERTTATAAASMANNLGSAVGMFLPPLLVNESRSSASDFATLFGAQAVVCVLVFIALLFLVPPHPVTPPSPTASPMLHRGLLAAVARFEGDASDGEGERATESSASAPAGAPSTPLSNEAALQMCGGIASSATWRGIRGVLTRNRAFLLLWGSFSVSIGSVWALNSVLPQVLDPYDISEGIAGWMGFTNIVAGTAAALLVGHFVDRHRIYKPTLISLTAGSVASVLAMYLTLLLAGSRTVLPLVFIFFVCAGIAQNAVVPVSFEFALELTFPEPESITSGMLMAGANACSFVMLNVATVMLGDAPSQKDGQKVIIFLAALITAGAVGLPFMAGQLRRVAAESTSPMEAPTGAATTRLQGVV